MGQSISECKPICHVSDPVTATVKVDPTLLGGKPMDGPKAKMQVQVEEVEVSEQQEEEEEERRKAVEEEQERERAQAEEERQRREAEEEARKQAEEAEERRRAEEAALAEQRAQEERERVAAAERARAEQAAAAAREKAEAEAAQKLVEEFLRRRGFNNLATPRRAFCGSSVYPLHLAVEECDVDTVRALLRCGADKGLKNSQKRSPLEMAEKLNKNCSHDAVVALLKAAV